jgi:hypothetical protein
MTALRRARKSALQPMVERVLPRRVESARSRRYDLKAISIKRDMALPLAA